MTDISTLATSRRDFIKGSAVVASSLLISFRFSLREAQAEESSFRPNAWLEITGREILFTLDRAEMGQGVYTTLAVIVAAELGVSPEILRIGQAPASRVYVNPMNGIQITGGSSSVSQSYAILRKAAATARFCLIRAAAERWGVDPKDCVSKDERIYLASSRDSFSFFDLAADAARVTPPEDVPLRNDDSLVGKPFIPRLDNLQKITGRARFGVDVDLPGQLIAIVCRAPKLGSRLESFDAKEVLTLPGVRAAFPITTGLAIVADRYWQLIAARERVTVSWREDKEQSALSSEKISERFHRKLNESGKELTRVGDFAGQIKTASKTVTADYELPYLAHATMEPCNFTADVRENACYLVGPTQSAGIAQQVAVELTGLPYEKVFVETTFLGGGFGRRLEQDYVKEAVEVSKQMKRPVKVMWSREDDMQKSPYRPANVHRLIGGLSSSGELIAWSHKMVGPSVLSRVASDYARTSFPQWLPGWMKNAGGWAGRQNFKWRSSDPTAMEGAANLCYRVPNLVVEYVQDDPGVPLAFWRSVGHSYTGFVVESFIDELSRAASSDPYEFRRKVLTGKEASRHLGVLDLVARKAGWGKKRQGIGRGIAQHASFGSYVAYAVDVKISDGEIRLDRVVAAVDCGLVVNPDGARAQMESAVNFALSAILKGEITLSDGAVSQSSFDTYELLRFYEAPRDIEVHFVESPHPPSGLGEPGVPPLSAAVANAIFDLNGKRLRRLPLKLDR